MKKKILGIKVGTILTVLFSLAAAILFWLIVRYSQLETATVLSIINF